MYGLTLFLFSILGARSLLGPIWTPLVAGSFPKEKLKEFGAKNPMKRQCGADCSRTFSVQRA
jgi:hypothetical protein